MKIFVSNSYGGDICSIKFEKDAQRCFGYAVKILGFVETNKVKVQHVSSHGKFITDEVRFKIPRNIIPTFESKNFKVWYMCECGAISKDAKVPFSFVFDISNNNFEDFQYTGPIGLDMNLVEEEEYLERKEEVCRLILSRMEAPLDPKNLLMPLSKDEKQKGTLSFIQHSSVLNASSPEQLSTSPMTGTVATAASDDADSPDLLPVPEDLGYIKMHSLQNGAKSDNTNPEKIVVEELGVESLSAGCKDNKISFRSSDDVFSREVDEEIKSLIVQLAAEDALREEHVDKIPVDAGHEDQRMLEEKWCPDPELSSNLQTTRPPSFREPNLLEMRSYESTSIAVEGEDTIARITYPAFMRGQGYIRIRYLRNVMSTQVGIWRQDYEDGCMIDTENVFGITFDSDSCLEKILEFDIRGFSLKTFMFEVRYVLSISFDDSEISLPINVLSPGAKVYVSSVEV